jgi:hypothetical protein
MIHQKSTCIPQNESPYNDHLMCIRSFLFFCVGPHNYSNYFYSRSSIHTHTHALPYRIRLLDLAPVLIAVGHQHLTVRQSVWQNAVKELANRLYKSSSSSLSIG